MPPNSALGGWVETIRTRALETPSSALDPPCTSSSSAPIRRRHRRRIPVGVGLDTLTEPRRITWATKAADLDQRAARARAGGVELGEVRRGQPEPSNGQVLSWRLTYPDVRLRSRLVTFHKYTLVTNVSAPSVRRSWNTSSPSYRPPAYQRRGKRPSVRSTARR